MGFAGQTLRRFFDLAPVTTPGASATAYVPLVMVSRALAFLRTLLVARILGEQGQEAFGYYQPALELVNPLVALALFGAADVAERYVSRAEMEHGRAGLRLWLTRHAARVGSVALVIAILLLGAAPWISRGIWGSQQEYLLAATVVTMALLAVYQFIAAALRGLRAYAAAGGMELLGAVLLLGLSAAAAVRRDAVWLMGAYGISVLVPMVLYGALLRRHLADVASPAPAAGAQEAPANVPIAGTQAPESAGVLTYARETGSAASFAAWSLVRMLLVMLFGFLAIWGVRYLGDHSDRGMVSGIGNRGIVWEAHFSMVYRIAQLLGFLAVTLWSSTYAIAARAWTHGSARRAKVLLFRSGKYGMVGLTLAGVALLLFRGIFSRLLPAYGGTIDSMLPEMIALFLWYAQVSFFSTYADVRERPQIGAALWGTAVLVQIAAIAYATTAWPWMEPAEYMLLASAGGLVAALVLVAPVLLCRPLHMAATGVPLAITGIAAITLFCPDWIVDYIATPAMLGAVLFLLVSGLLTRPGDRRAFRRFRTRRHSTSVRASAAQQNPR